MAMEPSATVYSQIRVIDSHTGGEPTRVIVSGGPDLGTGPIAARRERFACEFDHIRSAVVNEPRGSDVLVGAILGDPVNSDSVASVIFFNNVGCLNMCGHGTIGVAVTLAHLGKIGPGRHQLETPVGAVSFELIDPHRVAIENVAAFRYRKGVSIDVPGYGLVTGDIAWGGNWFFLVDWPEEDLSLANVDALSDFACRIRASLESRGVTGADGAEIDHIEIFSPARNLDADSQNFVLCPGKAYDRSPCGTGTSAKLACLHADGKLQPGQVFRQAGILGTLFEGSIRIVGDQVIPTITGTAYITGDAMLLLDSQDPFQFGILS